MVIYFCSLREHRCADEQCVVIVERLLDLKDCYINRQFNFCNKDQCTSVVTGVFSFWVRVFVLLAPTINTTPTTEVFQLLAGMQETKMETFLTTKGIILPCSLSA